MASLVGCEGGNGEHLRAGSPAGSVGSEFGGGESVQNAGSSPAASSVSEAMAVVARPCSPCSTVWIWSR